MCFKKILCAYGAILCSCLSEQPTSLIAGDGGGGGTRAGQGGWNDEFFNRSCETRTVGGCVSVGRWLYDPSYNHLICDAPPRTPSPELCNGVDDDCNGVTDVDAWPELHTCCAGSSVTSTFDGTWECDLANKIAICAGNFEETTPAACE